MKRTFKSIFIFAAAALTLVGCQKTENDTIQNDGPFMYSFAIAEDGTRAIIGDKNIEWVAGDQVGMFVGDYKGYAKIDVNKTPKMVVLYSNNAIPAGTMAYAYAPYDADNKTKEPNSVKITFNAVQTGASNSVMPLAGIPFEVEEEIDPKAQEGNGLIKFANLGSLINFKIFSTNESYQSETIQSIQFDATKAIAGVGYIDLTAIDINDEDTFEVIMDQDEKSVKVNQEVEVAAEKEEASPIKMVIRPGVFEGTLTVITDVATYTKVIPEREFARSHSRTFGLDLAKAERVEGVEETVMTLPYEETFTNNIGAFEIVNVVKPDALSAVWSYDSSYKCMKATAYVSGTRYETESMLVSPWIDLTTATSVEVAFDNAYRYVSEPSSYFTLWVKTNETGSEWSALDISSYGTGNFNWGNAKVDLSSYTGKIVKVAFKYISGGTDNDTGTWEIKNFQVTGKSATDPQIVAEDVTDIPVVGGSDFTTTYELVNFTNDDVVATADGAVVTEAVANNGTVTFTVAPNYTTSAKTGKITLSSASTEATKEINVVQIKSSGLKVSETTIVIPADATTATFTVTTADFGWNTEVTTLEGMNLSVNPASGSASEDAQTVTITSSTSAGSEAQDLGTILVYRNGNTSDTGKKTITVKKAAVAVAGLYTLDGTITATGNAYATASDVTQDGVSWKVTGNTEQSPWRIGGKNLTAIDRDVYSTTTIGFNVGKIQITHGAASNITVNSMTVKVATDEAFANVISTLTPSFAANGTVTVNRPDGADWTNCYYKIVYNVTVSGNTNRFLELSKAVFSAN